MATESPEELPDYLSAGYLTGPHDGGHGIFCASCAVIIRFEKENTDG